MSLINLFKYLIPNVLSKLKKSVVLIIVSVILIVISVGLIIVNYVSVHGYPLVKTKVGVIRGLRASDGKYSMFMGIPYAKINDSNPFGQAIPYPPFKGVFIANYDSALCPQLEEHKDTIAGTLDCLQINVYVPNVSTDRLPVLVYIFGGRYEVGSAGQLDYGPKFLVEHNIILVTLNYRLGPYGFLCLDTSEVPGNQGLRDQVLALKWIKENIEAFGGDRNQITLAGEGSGGQNVDFHVIYGQEGIFNKAIIGNGATMDHVTMVASDSSVPLEIVKDLGFNTSIVSEALDFLSKQHTDSVIKSSIKLNIKYGPCVEQKFDDIESFITKFPKTEIENVKNIPIMISSSETSHEFADKNLDTKHKDIFEHKLVKYFGFDNETLESMADYVRRFYIGDEEVSEKVKPRIIEFCSDLAVNYPIKRKIEQYLKNGVQDIYFSMFAYRGRRNFMKMFSDVDLDLDEESHVAELGYLFDGSYMREPITANDQLIIDRMTTLWANFVKYSNPTPETTHLLPVKWESTNESFLYLNIDLELSMMNAPFHERMKFWDSFFKVNGTTTNGETKTLLGDTTKLLLT